MGVSKTKDSVTGPLHLALDITNKCNYRCLHCYNASGENCVVNNELTDEEVLELINQISKSSRTLFASVEENRFCAKI